MKFFPLLSLSCFLWLALQAQDIPVDRFAGQPVINVPLCQVNGRSLTHNIGLVYNASGVKIDDRGGWVGQNWSLAAGGEVRRAAEVSSGGGLRVSSNKLEKINPPHESTCDFNFIRLPLADSLVTQRMPLRFSPHPLILGMPVANYN